VSPNYKITDERQEQILEAASRLIACNSVESVTMALLAEATGLSRPAIYQYFSSKEDVLAELVINEMADLSNEIDNRISGISDPLERIRIWIHYSLAHLASADHRIIRQISIDSLPADKRGMLNAMHGHFMTALTSPVREIGVADVTATCHLIYATVAAAAKRIDEGSEFVREAATLEQFTIAGLTASAK